MGYIQLMHWFGCWANDGIVWRACADSSEEEPYGLLYPHLMGFFFKKTDISPIQIKGSLCGPFIQANKLVTHTRVVGSIISCTNHYPVIPRT